MPRCDRAKISDILRRKVKKMIIGVDTYKKWIKRPRNFSSSLASQKSVCTSHGRSFRTQCRFEKKYAFERVQLVKTYSCGYRRQGQKLDGSYTIVFHPGSRVKKTCPRVREFLNTVIAVSDFWRRVMVPRVSARTLVRGRVKRIVRMLQ